MMWYTALASASFLKFTGPAFMDGESITLHGDAKANLLTSMLSLSTHTMLVYL